MVNLDHLFIILTIYEWATLDLLDILHHLCFKLTIHKLVTLGSLIILDHYCTNLSVDQLVIIDHLRINLMITAYYSSIKCTVILVDSSKNFNELHFEVEV